MKNVVVIVVLGLFAVLASSQVSSQAPTTNHARTIGRGVVMKTPDGLGTNGQVMTTNGAGTLTWSTLAGGGDLLSTNNLSDVANVATARANLNVDVAGTDNSTDVQLLGTPDYLTISGQDITRGLVDMATDITNAVPIANGGSGQTTQQAAIDALTNVAGATNEHVLTKDTGTGNAVWKAAAGGGGTPGGADTQVQFNDGGAFGGDANLTFDDTTATLKLGVTSGAGNAVSLAVTDLSNYPRLSFLIGDSDDTIVNAAMWAAPRGTSQFPCTLEALTNSDTTTNNTKRTGMRVETGQILWYGAEGNGSGGSQPIHIMADGLGGAKTATFLSSGYVGINDTNPAEQLSVISSATNVVGLSVDTPSSPSVDIAQFKASGSVLASFDSSGSLRGSYGPGGVTTNFVAGDDAGASFTTTDAIRNTLIGQLAGDSITSGDDNTIIGYNADLGDGTKTGCTVIGAAANSGPYGQTVVVGRQASSPSYQGVAIGYQAEASGNSTSNSPIAIGWGATAGANSVDGSIAIGWAATATEGNLTVIGSPQATGLCAEFRIPEFYRRVKGTVSTTDATVTTCDTFATATDTAYHVVARVVGRETVDSDEVASYELIGTFKNDGGTLSLVGSVTADHTGEDTAGWNATLDASGTDVRVRVTGAASTSIDWKCSMEVTEI